jgi:hypothetical protein
MLSDTVKLKITENKVAQESLSPRFIISYANSKKKAEQQQENSYEIISLLKSKNDFFIEVTSSLLSTPAALRENEVLSFINHIKLMNLDYRYRQLPSSGEKNIFSQLLSRSPSTNHHVLVHIPQNIWTQEAFKSILPINGVRYYIPKGDVDSSKVLDDLFNGLLPDAEKIELFKLIIFDSCSFGQMGISGKDISLAELKNILC